MFIKRKFYISIDNELYQELLKVATKCDIAVSDLLKLVEQINVRTIQLREFSGKNTRVAYYAKEKFLRLHKGNVNYKILRFLEIYEGNFI